jgi:hypothetical protein
MRPSAAPRGGVHAFMPCLQAMQLPAVLVARERGRESEGGAGWRQKWGEGGCGERERER